MIWNVNLYQTTSSLLGIDEMIDFEKPILEQALSSMLHKPLVIYGHS